MKKMMMVLLLFAALQGFTQTTERNVQDLTGVWRNRSGAGFDVVDSNTVYIVRGNQRKLAFATISDVRQNPVTFTLTVKDSAKVTTLKTQLVLMSDNSLQWQVYDSETRPASYGSRTRGDLLYLKRIERLTN